MPGGPSYKDLDGMAPYDAQLWASPAAKYGAAWDTGRAAVLQQPVRNSNVVTRGTYQLGPHRIGPALPRSRIGIEVGRDRWGRRLGLANGHTGATQRSRRP